MFPTIPENLSALSDEALAALRGELRDAVAALKAQDTITADDMENARAAKAAFADIKGVLAERASTADELAEIEAELSDVTEDEADDTEDDTDDEVKIEGDDDLSGTTEVVAEEVPADEVEVVTASARRRPTSAALAEVAPRTPAPPKTPDALAMRFKSAGVAAGYSAGDNFENMTDLAGAMVSRYKDIQGGSSDKIAVAVLEGRFAENAQVEPGRFAAFDPFNPESIQAGLDCVPREPVYDVGCASSIERPFANSLPNKQTARGGFSVYSSPMLADVDGGTGTWTRADDGDDEAVKEACAVIPCGDTEDYDIYGVYRCITVKNLLQMTFPELVAAFLNKLGASWARLAETTLLDAAINSANVTDVTGEAVDNVGATVNLIDNLLQVACVYTEQERYSDGLSWGVWLPRWVATLVIRDWLHAPRYNPTFEELVVARSQINSLFRRAGFTVHWTMDSASTWESIGTQGAGALETLPTKVDMLIALEGNFQRLDKGTLTVGVTNRSPWDLDDMARNQFTVFWESFEGIYDAGCPSYTLSIDPLCPNGLVHFAPGDAPACESAGS